MRINQTIAIDALFLSVLGSQTQVAGGSVLVWDASYPGENIIMLWPQNFPFYQELQALNIFTYIYIFSVQHAK